MSCTCLLCLSVLEKGTTWREIVSLALFALTHLFSRPFFHVRTEIYPFIQSHWNQLWKVPKNPSHNWQPTVHMTLSKYTQVFLSSQEAFGYSCFWSIRNIIIPKHKQSSEWDDLDMLASMTIATIST